MCELFEDLQALWMYASTPVEPPESRAWRPAHTHPSPPALWRLESVSAPGSTRPTKSKHQDAGKLTNVAITLTVITDLIIVCARKERKEKYNAFLKGHNWLVCRRTWLPSGLEFHPLYERRGEADLPASSPDLSPGSSLPEPWTLLYASHTDSVHREKKHIACDQVRQAQSSIAT